MMKTSLDFSILAQPDQITCGPTCLHAVYRFLGDSIGLDEVVDEISMMEGGGTLGVFLGCHALRRGYSAKLYSYNLQVFDPSWFRHEDVDLSERLRSQLKYKQDAKLRLATQGYLEFLKLGGTIGFEDLRPNLVRRYLKKGVPILTGLSATYLYQTPREYGPNDDYDDLRGKPSGHFVVLCGYDMESREISVADPLKPNPAYDDHLYSVPIERAINAILLGILTYDANLVVIEKKPVADEKRAHKKGHSHE